MNSPIPDDTDQKDPDPDDALAELLADAIIELARKPGSHRLTAMQMAGLADDPPSPEDVAKAMGIGVRKVAALERRALFAIAHFHPELFEELRPWIAPVAQRK